MTPAEVHAQVQGPAGAPVVVLSPSLGTTLELWEPQLPTLSERFRVVRYDVRGHGRSPAPPGPYELADLAGDVIALLDSLGVQAADICGISLGGMTAMALAAAHPERVRRLVLCCTSAKVGPPERWAERAAAVRSGGMASIAGPVVERWLTPEYAAAHPEQVEGLRAMLLACDPEGYAACCGAIERMDLRPLLGSISAPTLVVAGGEDLAIPPEHDERIAAGIEQARLEMLSPAAHLANVERADELNRLLLEHLTQEGGRPMTDDRTEQALERGMRRRREVLGDGHVDAAAAATTPLSAPFQDFITRYAWGEVWSRPGLDQRTRSCITLAVLTALHCHDELAMHLRAALRNGLTPEEIAEVLLHTAVYAGVPAANQAFAVAGEVLGEQRAPTDGGDTDAGSVTG